MTEPTAGSENISENKEAPSHSPWFVPARLRQFTLYVGVSLAVLIPCYWHRYIQAGDLGSHVYNAWLAQMVQQGRGGAQHEGPDPHGNGSDGGQREESPGDE